MSQQKTLFGTLPKGTLIGVVVKNGKIILQKFCNGNSAPTPIPAAASDKKGLKNYIAFDVAHGMYPNGTRVDPNEVISGDMSSIPGIRASQANLYGNTDSLRFGYTWAQIDPGDLSPLKIVGQLMDLVISHLQQEAK